MAESKLKLIIEAVMKGDGLTKAAEGLKDVNQNASPATTALNNLKGTLMKAGVELGAFALATKGLAFLRDAANDWSLYAEEMQKGADVAKMTVEEYSRLVQAADDFRVSQETLERSLGMAAKNGFEPTIENLAMLSDKFLEANTATEQANLLYPIFGRTWQELVPLLKQGSSAILESTASIADGLVVTEAASEANRRYYESLDEMQDSWTAVKNQIGQAVVPAFNNLFAVATDNEEAIQRDRKAIADWIETLPPFIQGLMNAEGWIDDVNYAYYSGVGIQEDYVDRQAKVRGGADEVSLALAEERQRLEDLNAKMTDASVVMQEYTKQLLYKIATQDMDSASALLVAEKMGLINETTATAAARMAELRTLYETGRLTAEQYASAVGRLSATISSLQDKEVNVKLNLEGDWGALATFSSVMGGTWHGDAPMTAHASGGPVKAYDPYLWQEYGYRGEVKVDSRDGYVLSRSEAAAAVAQGVANSDAGAGNRNAPLIGTVVVNNNVQLEQLKEFLRREFRR